MEPILVRTLLTVCLEMIRGTNLKIISYNKVYGPLEPGCVINSSIKVEAIISYSHLSQT